MGAVAYGRKVREDDESVSYTFAIEPAAPEGVLVIPVVDPDAWYVDGSDARPTAALRVLGKAVLTFRRSGSWPEVVAFQS